MKFAVCFAIVAAIAIDCVLANTAVASSSNANNAEAETDVAAPLVSQALADLTRLRKSAYGGSSGGGYGGASIPAPPCPKNYLFSCQPNLAPVPCSAPSSSYGSVGAYSSPVASYVTANRAEEFHQPIYSANAAAYYPQAYAYHY